jgi:adenylate cyclase
LHLSFSIPFLAIVFSLDFDYIGFLLSFIPISLIPTLTGVDQEGKILVADLGMVVTNSKDKGKDEVSIEDTKKIPILLGDATLGWVIGIEQVEQVANSLSYVVNREFERKALAAEALDKYREINLLYTIASKMSNCLDVKAIATLVIEEASRMIVSTSASVMLHNEQNSCLEIISAKGTAINIQP